MTNKFYALAIASILFVSACSEWPPHQEELAERFEENRDAFEQLEAKILTSNLVRVSGGCVLDSDGERTSNRVQLLRKVDEAEGKEYPYERDYVEDAEWTDLFCQVFVWSVENHDGVVTIGFGSSIPHDDMTTFVEYIHSREMLESRRPCLPEIEQIPCGLCSVPLDDEWYLEYWWSPDELVPDGFSRVLDGEMTEDEYRELYDRSLEQCRIDGYREIGYDLDELGGDDSKVDQQPEND